MNCSYLWLRELVETDLPPGEVAAALTRVGLNVEEQTFRGGADVCFDVEVTSNRPDCLGHLGVARELAAALRTRLTFPPVVLEEGDEAARDATAVQLDEPDLCPLYTARILRGVKVGRSSDWMLARLEAIGIRPVNNIVDVTNYVMMECGQPLHAFDFARLAEGRIVVRRARPGERFVAIDHSEHTLTPERLVIADASRAVALAGVMGGAETEISEATTDVLLEAAVFDPLSIRTTARTLSMMSDSSYRFERRVDSHMSDWASRRAAQLMGQVAGGTVARGVVVAGAPLTPVGEVTLRFARVPTLLGMDVPADACVGILERLGCEPTRRDADAVTVRVPTWRQDLTREADLVEEVARHTGYDAIPVRDETRVVLAPPTRRQEVQAATTDVLMAAGYHEAVTFSFTTGEKAVRLASAKADGEPLRVRGEALVLRQSVLPGLLDSLRVNRRAGTPDATLFEIADRYVPRAGEALPREDTMLALAGPDDFLGAKGTVEALLGRLGLAGRTRFEPGAPHCPDLDPAASVTVLLEGGPLGVLGRVGSEAAKAFDLDDPPVVAELVFDRLVEAAELVPSYRPLPTTPPVERDLAIVLDEATPWANVEAAIRGAGVEALEAARPLEVYRGKQVAAGKKSVALRLVFRVPGRTLTGEEADAMLTAILDALDREVEATLRGT